MTNIAQHIRIYEASPSDDFVTKRTASINALAASFKKKRTDLVSLANDVASIFIPGGKVSDALATTVADAIAKESPSFDKEASTHEINVCAALAVLVWLENCAPSGGPLTSSDLTAVSLWSALSFQKTSSDTRLEKLRDELIQNSRKLALGSAELSRQRIKLPDTPFALAAGDQAPEIEKKVGDTLGKAIDALRTNAALDREEIDVLWWALCDWSSIAKKRFSELAPEQAILGSAIELSKLLRRLPADFHRHLMLRHISNSGEAPDLGRFLQKISVLRDVIGGLFKGNALIAANPHVFPLLTSLNESEPKPSGHDVTRTLDDWGGRVLIEAAIIHLQSSSAVNL